VLHTLDGAVALTKLGPYVPPYAAMLVDDPVFPYWPLGLSIEYASNSRDDTLPRKVPPAAVSVAVPSNHSGSTDC
jgi:hypothetical protein